MTSIKNYKPATVLVAVAALAGIVAVSTVAIGIHTAFAADTETTTVTKNVNNTGVNVPTNNQKIHPLLLYFLQSSTDNININ
jgi:hypothetical protein